MLRYGKPIKNNILPSIWYGMKTQFTIIIDNSSWLLGNDMKANL